MDFVFGEIPKKLVPFDWEAYQRYSGRFIVGVTNAGTGKGEYLDGRRMDERFTMLRASCAIPLVFPPIVLEGAAYYDGGVADPIPIRKSMADGNQKNLIVLTRPEGYVKRLSKKNIAAAAALKHHYPNMIPLLLHRHKRYNKVNAWCSRLEKEGRAVVLRPEMPLRSLENDVSVLEKSYWHGYHKAMERMEEIRKLF